GAPGQAESAEAGAAALENAAAHDDPGVRHDGVAHAVEQESAGDDGVPRAHDDRVGELTGRDGRRDRAGAGEHGEQRDDRFHDDDPPPDRAASYTIEETMDGERLRPR